MVGRCLKRPGLLLWPWIWACLFLGGSCQSLQPQSQDEETALPVIKRVVVVGFRAAISQGEVSEVVRDPLTGAVFSGEPVPARVVREMNGPLFQKLLEEKRYDLISPGQARGVLSAVVGLDSSMGMGPSEILQKVGKRFGADAVLAGYIYRWREREGGDYAVRRPASVAFDLFLLRPVDRAILWRGRFDKTQRSLSENVLDLETFLEGGGRWMTAQDLAMLGLIKLVGDMLAATGEGKE